MFKIISDLPRSIKILLIILIDICFIAFSIEAAFSTRLGILYVPDSEVLLIYFAAILIALPIFYFFGLYSLVLKYISLDSLWSIFKSTTLYTLLLGIFIYFSGIEGVPRSIILINLGFISLCIVSSRLFANSIIYSPVYFSSGKEKIKHTRIVILGVNDAAVQLSASLKNENKLSVMYFLDDSKKFIGQKINNIKIIKIDNLEKIINEKNISKLLISKSDLLAKNQNLIQPLLQKYPITIQEIPALKDLANNISIQNFKSINIEELLNRDVIMPNPLLLNKNIKDKIVMVTGAGGSIGSELSIQAFKIKPSKIILFDHSEYALYQIIEKIKKINEKSNLNIEIVYVLGSITQEQLIRDLCKSHRVDTIFHAAAYKHVNMLEENIIEGLRNNILGTLNCAKIAKEEKVKNFVLVSTDKAVRPTSVMGFTKRIAELVILKLNYDQNKLEYKTKFTIVRFGNVIGSSGSAIPLFKKQIQDGGPVTVTDPEVIRYFMTIKEAAELVIQASGMDYARDIYFLDMGEQIKILDLVKKMIHLAGKTVYNYETKSGEIEIIFTGLKKGEKLYEELSVDEEKHFTEHPRIFALNEDLINLNDLEKKIEYLENNIDKHCAQNLVSELSNLVPEFKIDKQDY